jgi:anti-anti-sigma regulatory factor
MAGNTKSTTGTPGAKRQRSRVIRLDESLDISTLETLHGQWSKALECGRPLAIDGGRVQHIDGAALQLLCALWRDAPHRNVDMRWREVSPVIRDAAAVAGLSCAIGLSSTPGESP